MAINQAWTCYTQRDSVIRGPVNDIGQQTAVIGEVIASEAPIEIRWQKRNRAAGVCIENQARDIGLWFPHPGRFRRINRKLRYKGQVHFRCNVQLKFIQNPSEGQNVSLVKAIDDGMSGT